MVINSATKVGTSKKLQPIWKGPFVVVEAISEVLYKVADRKKITVQHVDRMRPYVDRTVPLWVQQRRARLLHGQWDRGRPPEGDCDDLSEALEEMFSDPLTNTMLVDSPVSTAGACQPTGSSDHMQSSPLAGASLYSPDDDSSDTDRDSWNTAGGEEPNQHLPTRQTRAGRHITLPRYLHNYDVQFR